MCFRPLHDAAVVVVARSRAGLEACLESLIAAVAHAEQQGIRTFISVIDNGSEDDVAGLLDGYHESVYWTRYSRERGYAQTRNHALRIGSREGYPHLIFIDPQIGAPPSLIAHLVGFMRRHDDVGLAEASLQSTAAATWRAEDRDRSPRAIEQAGSGPAGTAKREGAVSAGTAAAGRDQVTLQGAVFIARTAMIDTVGSLDETYRTRLALDDLCRRALLDQWRVVLAPQITLQHQEAAEGFDLAPGPVREVLYYTVCEPAISWRQLAQLVGVLLVMDLAMGLRRNPMDNVVKFARFATAATALAFRWQRVLASRQAARRLIDHPTWDRSDADTAESKAARR